MLKIKHLQPTNVDSWDSYVQSHPNSTLYHRSGWKNVIEKTYGHKTFYLMAVESSQPTAHSSKKEPWLKAQSSKLIENELKSSPNYAPSAMSHQLKIVGILPLVHLKHFIFGNSLISIPFFDFGGILADNEEAEKALLSEAIKLGQKHKADNIELRHTGPLKWLTNSSPLIAHSSNEQPKTEQKLTAHSSKLKEDESSTSPNYDPSTITYQLPPISCVTESHKVRMLLELPEASEILMESFKSKLRSQVKRPMKDGLTSKICGLELLDDFYSIFLANMRDLGSPVHSKKIIENVLMEFPEKVKIVTVYKENQPLASSLIVGFKDTLENPWASSLRQFSRLNPNMLLYWTMLEYACDNGFKFFDFGRSSPGEGTFKFKEQWGSKPQPLHWQYIALNGKPISENSDEKSKFDKAIQYWQKLPVPVTKVIGPMIRKHIGL